MTKYVTNEAISEWKDPVRVLGQHGPVIFVRCKSCYIKANVYLVQHTTMNDFNNIEPDVTTPPTQLMKPAAEPNQKPSINKIMDSENESNNDNNSRENHNIFKNTETKDSLDIKTTDSADLPKLKRNNKIRFIDENNI